MNTSNRLVKFKNTVNSKVIVFEPAYNIRREFPGKGAIQTIPFDLVEQLLWRPGFKNLVQTGILYIEDMQDKIDLQLEDPDTKTPTKIKVFTDEQILTLLRVRNYDDFVKELSTVSVEQANNVVDYAINNDIIDTKKCDYLKTITGRDIIKSIAHKRQAADVE